MSRCRTTTLLGRRSSKASEQGFGPRSQMLRSRLSTWAAQRSRGWLPNRSSTSMSSSLLPRSPRAIARLETLGYEHRGDLGIPGREAFAAPADSPRHHLYLCPSDSEALANHLAVRDALRDSASEARAYGELKKRLAGEFSEDIDGYIEAKMDFLLRLLKRAGFSNAALADIRRMNAR